jgi:hypothetical protein
MSTATQTTKVETIAFVGLSAAEQPIVARIQSGLAEIKQVERNLSRLSITVGHDFCDLRVLGSHDKNKYSVTLPGKDKPENVSRFEAAYNWVGISRATVYRYIRAYEAHLKATNPVPSAITQMATSNGVLDVTTKIAQEALADAFLAAGQPSNPTPQQCMTIVADACDRANVASAEPDAKQTALKGVTATFREYYKSFMKGSGDVSEQNEQMWLMGAQWVANKVFGVIPSDEQLLALGRGTVQIEVAASETEAATA